MNKKLEIVVARYNENIDWLEPYLSDSTIYNKGRSIAGKDTVPLPNIGREGHSYLYHIIENYDNLADRTIFCQGDPFEHSPDFLQLLNDWQHHLPVQALNWRWIEHDSLKAKPKQLLGKIASVVGKHRSQSGVPPLWIREKYTDNHLHGARIFVDILGSDMIPVYPTELSVWTRKRKNSIDLIMRYGSNTLREIWLQLEFDEKTPSAIHSNVAAQFSVTREAILSRPQKFYEGIMDFLLSDEKENLRHGILLERLWLAIFRYSHFNPDISMPEEL